MKGKDLLVIGAAILVLYKLAQVKPQTQAQNETGITHNTNMPVLSNGSISLFPISPARNTVPAYETSGNLWSYGNPANGGDPFRAMRDKFINWVNDIPVGISPDDPRLRPAVIDVSGMV